ncbi:MAG: ABC transporter permease [Candidatus Kerfeldbacteria bacterium]|nr:ABC transporter permease [Candidatus Kerfeldbacteria bacterium]
MKPIDVFYIAKDTFRSNKLRTFLTVGAVVIGIGAIVFLVSLGRGLEEITVKQITSSEALRLLNVSKGKSDILKLDAETVKKFKDIESIESVSPRASFSVQATLGETTTESVLHSVESKFAKLEVNTLASGDYFTDATGGVVVSSTLSKLLGYENTSEILGKEIGLAIFIPVKGTTDVVRKEKTYTVHGVVETEDENYLFAPLSSLADVEFGEYSSVKALAKAPELLASTRTTIQDMGYFVESPADTLTEVTVVFNVVKVILAIFGVIALVVASIGMFNTLTISLLERTRDIGIMKSVGATNRDVMAIFLSEALVVGLIGGVIGIGAGWLVGFLANSGINILAERYGGETVQLFIVNLDLAVAMLILSVLLGFITGLYPSWRASRLNPLWALRYE